MAVEMSITQRKRLDKIERLRQHFAQADRAEIDEWNPATDEPLDFKAMTDAEVANYIAAH